MLTMSKFFFFMKIPIFGRQHHSVKQCCFHSQHSALHRAQQKKSIVTETKIAEFVNSVDLDEVAHNS